MGVVAMDKILLIVHPDEQGQLPKIAREAVSAVRELSNTLGVGFDVGAFGGTVQEVLRAVGQCGAERFYAMDGEALASARYSSDCAAVTALAKAAGATVVVLPATSRVNRVLAGAAHRLGGRADSHVTRLSLTDGKLQATRWYYRQRMMAVIEREARPWLLALESGVAPAWQGASAEVAVENVPLTLSANEQRTRVEGLERPPADQQTIRPDADLLFVAGAGWTKKQRDGQVHVEEADQIIREFLAKSGASLGGSKSIVDQTSEGGAVLSCMSHMNQVGQTGSTPRHPKGLATCCHGEEPHVVGWRFINERRAVNLDPNCGWAHGKADVLYVADAFEVMRKVNELLG